MPTQVKLPSSTSIYFNFVFEYCSQMFVFRKRCVEETSCGHMYHFPCVVGPGQVCAAPDGRGGRGVPAVAHRRECVRPDARPCRAVSQDGSGTRAHVSCPHYQNKTGIKQL